MLLSWPFFFLTAPVCARRLHHTKPAHPLRKQRLITRQCGLNQIPHNTVSLKQFLRAPDPQTYTISLTKSHRVYSFLTELSINFLSPFCIAQWHVWSRQFLLPPTELWENGKPTFSCCLRLQLQSEAARLLMDVLKLKHCLDVCTCPDRGVRKALESEICVCDELHLLWLSPSESSRLINLSGNIFFFLLSENLCEILLF